MSMSHVYVLAASVYRISVCYGVYVVRCSTFINDYRSHSLDYQTQSRPYMCEVPGRCCFIYCP